MACGVTTHFVEGFSGREASLATLFEATFTASEGAEEGAAIAGLVRGLLQTTDPADILVVTALDTDTPVGAGIFTRLRYSDDPRVVFLLSPMAVATSHQGQGIGQALIRHALDLLRSRGVDVAMTYGDPAFYGKVGFKSVDVSTAPAPRPLSQPIGWIGQSLSGAPLSTLKGRAACAATLDDPAFW